MLISYVSKVKLKLRSLVFSPKGNMYLVINIEQQGEATFGYLKKA